MSTPNQSKSFLVGLIGAGIGGSLTPAMHEEEGSQLGLHYVYRRIDLEALKLDVSALPEILVAAERMGFNGLNVTYPAKQQIIPLLDELSDDARVGRGQHRAAEGRQAHWSQHRLVGLRASL